jgi:nucleoside-diphosphate-sugar epimerase
VGHCGQENILVQDRFLRLFDRPMRILLIGGNGFIGRFVVAALKQQGHALGVFHRGPTPTPAGVDEIRGDRNQLNASAPELKRFAPDVVIDLVISSGPQAEELMNIFRGATGRMIMLSSIDVYRAADHFPCPAKWPPPGTHRCCSA